MVHQHFVLVDRFTVAENVILGAEGGPLIDLECAAKKIEELAAATVSRSTRTAGSTISRSVKSNGSRSSRRCIEGSMS